MVRGWKAWFSYFNLKHTFALQHSNNDILTCHLFRTDWEPCCQMWRLVLVQIPECLHSSIFSASSTSRVTSVYRTTRQVELSTSVGPYRRAWFDQALRQIFRKSLYVIYWCRDSGKRMVPSNSCLWEAPFKDNKKHTYVNSIGPCKETFLLSLLVWRTSKFP